MYIFVRKDLTPPQQAVQASHAAIESTKRWPYNGDHPHLVVLGVKSEESLQNALDKVQACGILTAPFYENNGELTAFATRPIIKDEERRFLKRYQLLR